VVEGPITLRTIDVQLAALEHQREFETTAGPTRMFMEFECANRDQCGPIDQLVDRFLGMEEVSSSNLDRSTIFGA
jgi:hypothetical protein